MNRFLKLCYFALIFLFFTNCQKDNLSFKMYKRPNFKPTWPPTWPTESPTTKWSTTNDIKRELLELFVKRLHFKSKN